VSGNYVPAVAVRGGPDPRSAGGRELWWGAHFLTAEYGGRARQGRVGEYPQMPDDYTPGMTSGQALSGHRRTHRMAYSNHAGGFTLRMPSATSVKAFDGEVGGTFDVPVSARGAAGRTVSGWVRVTHHRGGWAGTPVGDFGPRTGAQVAESVVAVPEARRPSRALDQVGDLLARRRERERAQGVPVSAVRSSFIAGVGYDKATGTMAVAMTGGRLYGYQVPPEVHRAVAQSGSPGGAYNALVKGTGRAGIARCAQCGRFYPDTAGHRCPIQHAKRPATTRNVLARDAAGGFDAGSIQGWLDAGFTTDDAPEWAARWIQPADASDWRAAGFCAVEAFMWRAQRVERAAARAYVTRGLRDPLLAVRAAG